MKILHIIDSGGLYGAEIMLLHLMRAQVDLGLEPVLASIGASGEGEKALETETRLRGLRVETFRMRNGPNWPGAVKILRFAWDNGIDLLHTHGYKGNILFGLLPRSFRRLPLVATIHGWTWTKGWNRMRVYEWLDGQSLRFADKVVLVSQAMKKHPRVKKIRSDKIAVIANGIPLNSFRGQNVEQRQDIVHFAAQGFSIVAVGRLSSEKGLDILIKAAAQLVNDGYDLRLAILGQGELRHQLEKQAQDLGLNGRVLFAGYVDNAGSYLEHFDLFCLPSLTEGLPMVLLEAMAAKVPVIATSVGGVPEVLDHGRAGILVEPASVRSLKDALISVLRKPRETLNLVQEASNRVEKMYSSQAMAREYLQVYQEQLTS